MSNVQAGSIVQTFNVQHLRSRRDDEVDAAVVVTLKDVIPKLDASRLVDAAIDLANIPVEAMDRVGPVGRSVPEGGLDQSEPGATLVIVVVKFEIAVADDHLILSGLDLGRPVIAVCARAIHSQSYRGGIRLNGEADRIVSRIIPIHGDMRQRRTKW